MSRLNKFIKSFKTDDISMDDITFEVEQVRTERYGRKKNYANN